MKSASPLSAAFFCVWTSHNVVYDRVAYLFSNFVGKLTVISEFIGVVVKLKTKPFIALKILVENFANLSERKLFFVKYIFFYHCK